MANRKRNIQMNFYVTENKKRLIDERIKLLASLPHSISFSFGNELPFVTITSQNVSNICIFLLFCEPLCPIRLHLSILKWVSSVRENGSSHRELCGKEKE